MNRIDDNTPVLIGCAQITQREPDPLRARSPIELMADATRAAAADSHAGDALLGALDTVVVIRSFADTSWRFACPFGRYENPPAALLAQLGVTARRHIYTQAGGNMPQWSVNRLGEQISRGETDVALIVGGEALGTQKAAQRAGLQLDWAVPADRPAQSWGVEKRGWSDMEDRHGMRGAIYTYPLFEQAIRAARGRSVTEHQQALGELLARFAAVAANNPLADRQEGFDAATISQVGPANPMIGLPYTRLMNANAFIDQSAAVFMCRAGRARALGVPRDRWVFLHGHADAHDHWYITDRRDLHSSPAMQAVFDATFRRAATTLQEIDFFDIYSCFSSAVQVACDALGLSERDPRGLTLTGGLPYFGGPGNNYVTHSIAESMNRVRAAPGSRALVTANGNYLTKHSAGIYSSEAPPPPGSSPTDAQLQSTLNTLVHPPVAELASGAATVETWTVMHDRTGPTQAIVIGRLSGGERFIANSRTEPDVLKALVQRDMIGVAGKVTNDGQTNCFEF